MYYNFITVASRWGTVGDRHQSGAPVGAVLSSSGARPQVRAWPSRPFLRTAPAAILCLSAAAQLCIITAALSVDDAGVIAPDVSLSVECMTFAPRYLPPDVRPRKITIGHHQPPYLILTLTLTP